MILSVGNAVTKFKTHRTANFTKLDFGNNSLLDSIKWTSPTCYSRAVQTIKYAVHLIRYHAPDSDNNH